MALINAEKVALCAIALVLLLVNRATAQSTSPSNDTSSLQGDVGFLLSTTLNNMATSVKIIPLSNNAGLAGTTQQLQAINPTGPLFVANPGTENQLVAGDIAYISCEPSDYVGGQIDAPRCINSAVENRPSAIVLFSEFSARCGFSPSDEFAFTSIYTTEDAGNASALLKGLQAGSPRNPNTSIHVDLSTINGTSNNNSNNNVLGKSPTTAVAMIILYSITGIITALFLIIIIVGAIRAHRHPERYGPRRIVGRPRQSRAKGIARAMLETLPIVKFGELEEDKTPDNRSADMELGVTNPEHMENGTAPPTLPKENAEGSDPETNEESETEQTESVEASAVEAATTKPDNTIQTGTAAVDNGLACSVCVEDFEKGQDVRVLPCKHRFHPECIDPWLLNVSGTCPLCRVDLRPTASHEDGEDELTPAGPATTSAEDATTAAAFNETTRRNRRSRILHTLNIGRMRNATPEERLAALRMLRNEQIIGHPASGTSTPRSRNRFSQRFSRTFGSRPHSGAATPRRNSGGIATGRTSPSVETHPTHEMESTTEEPTAIEELPSHELSATAETPSIAEGPQLGQAHAADAPHAAGSAHLVNVPQRPESNPDIRPSETIQNDSERPEDAKSPHEDEQKPPQSSSSSDHAADSHPPRSTAAPPSSSPTITAPTSPSEPDLAPFYSYR